MNLRTQAAREALKVYIESKGAIGVLMMLGLQILQVIIAFIPGEFVEVLSGLLYGTFGGFVICTVGMLIASICIYYGVRKIGYHRIEKLLGSEKLSQYKFLHDARRLQVVIFILFFIPGTPKDLLTYFVPFTNIKPLAFFIIISVARIPSVVSSTFVGASLGEAKWGQSILIFVLIGVLGIVGIFINDIYMKKMKHND